MRYTLLWPLPNRLTHCRVMRIGATRQACKIEWSTTATFRKRRASNSPLTVPLVTPTCRHAKCISSSHAGLLTAVHQTTTAWDVHSPAKEVACKTSWDIPVVCLCGQQPLLLQPSLAIRCQRHHEHDSVRPQVSLKCAAIRVMSNTTRRYDLVSSSYQPSQNSIVTVWQLVNIITVFVILCISVCVFLYFQTERRQPW